MISSSARSGTASSTACQKRDGRAKPRASMLWLFKV